MALRIQHVTSGKIEDATEEQWKKIKKLFPGTFRKVEALENYSVQAKVIIEGAKARRSDVEE